MPVLLVRSEAFELDVRAQVDWLEEHLELERLLRFSDELHQLEALLASFPELGVGVEVSAVHFRKALFSSLPFLIWYRHGPPRDEVQLLRLFHAHQDRPMGRPRRQSVRKKRAVR